jgi:hypothetical protein
VLNNILALIFCHPKRIEAIRLRFAQKVDLVRAYSRVDDQDTIWSLIENLNTARNHIAHRLEGDTRDSKIAELKKGIAANVGKRHSAEFSALSDRLVIIVVCSVCMAFLAILERDMRLAQT